MKRFKKSTWSFTLFGAILLSLSVPFISSCEKRDVVEKEYTVSFVTNCSTTIPDRIYNTKKKDEFVLPSSSDLFKFGHDFVGWCYDEPLLDLVDPNNIIITSDTTLYGKWAAGVYQISFETGTNEVIPNMDVAFNETVILPTPQPKTINGTDYLFKRWYFVADNSYHTNSFTLRYPENVHLVAEFDYYVYSSFKLNNDGTYQLNISKSSVTDISNLPLAYGTFSADITYSTYNTGVAGFIWNASLDKNTNAPWEAGSSYYLFHMNTRSGAVQLAHNNDGVYKPLQTKQLSQLTESFRTKYEEGKANATPTTFAFSVTFNAEVIEIKLDGETQLTFTESLPFYKGLGVGFRASDAGVLYSNPRIEASHYQIDFENEGGDAVMPLRVEVNTKFSESGQVLPTPTKLGYEFEYWMDENGTKFDVNAILTENIILYPKYSVINGGAFITFVGNNERVISQKFVSSGEVLGELPVVTKAGFDLEKWFILDGEDEVTVNEDSVLVDAAYQGEAKQISVYAKWTRIAGEETDVNVEALLGSYTKDENLDGYIAYTPGRGSMGTFYELEEGILSTYIKFNTSGANGLVIGGNFLEDFSTNVDTNYMSVGSSYYYWHFNNANGIYQFVKVTDPINEASLNESAKGYDVLFQGTIDNFIAGSRHHLSVEFHNGFNSRVFVLSIDGVEVTTVVDDGSVAGPVLPGNSLGFRNATGGCTYYGLNIKEESDLACGDINLSVDGVIETYTRHYGWELHLPTPEKENYAFVGWTTTENDIDTLFNHNVTMSEEYNGITLYAYFIDSSKSMIVLNPNGGVLESTVIICDAGVQISGLLPTPTRDGYKFVSWQEDGVDITPDRTADSLVINLTANWGTVAENILEINVVNPRMNTAMDITTDGVYNFHAMRSDAGIAVFNGTFKTGKIRVFFKAPLDATTSTGDYGIVFRGTNLETTSSTAGYSQYSCYCMRFTQGNGFMSFYDMGDSSGSGRATLLGSSSWAAMFGDAPFFNKIHALEVQVSDQGTSAAIKIYVNGVLVFDVIAPNAYQGEQLGLRLTANSKKTPTGSFFGMHTVA